MKTPHVLWLDNFSKSYAVAMQTISNGAFRNCQWTGLGVKKYIGRAVDLRLHLSTTGMPDNMFSRGLNTRMTQIITRMSSSQWSYFQSSYVVTMNVNQVPLKPRVSWVEHPDLHRILSESRDGLTNFFPLKIEKHNIGSNRGLLTILKDLSIERKASLQAGDTDNIRVVCVDCNIFMRVLKVRINVTGIVPIVIYFSVFLRSFCMTLLALEATCADGWCSHWEHGIHINKRISLFGCIGTSESSPPFSTTLFHNQTFSRVLVLSHRQHISPTCGWHIPLSRMN